MNTARDYPSAPAGLAKRIPPPGTLHAYGHTSCQQWRERAQAEAGDTLVVMPCTDGSIGSERYSESPSLLAFTNSVGAGRRIQ